MVWEMQRSLEVQAFEDLRSETVNFLYLAGPGKQRRIKSFFEQDRPDADKPALERKPAPKGRRVSEAMKDVLADVAREQMSEIEASEARLVTSSEETLYSRRQTSSVERPVAVQIRLLQGLEKHSSGHASEAHFLTAMANKLGMSRSEVSTLWKGRDKLRSAASEKKLLQQGSKRNWRIRRYSGKRLPGAGRKSELLSVQQSLKAWFEEQRSKRPLCEE